MRNVCKIDNCKKFVQGKGFCPKHYYALRKYNNPYIDLSHSRKKEKNGMYGVHRFGEENPFYGRKHTEQTKQRIRASKIGKKLTEDHKRKIRENTPRGEFSPHWRGGVKRKFNNIYLYWSKSVKKRDSYRCCSCGAEKVSLHAHHIKPYSLFPELRYEVSNGLTLCAPCHRKTDSYAKRYDIL